MTLLRKLARQIWLLALVSTLVASVVSEGLFASRLALGAEHFYSDLWHRLAGVRHEPAHTALVSVDDDSLMVRPDEPLVFWTPYFAQAAATLRAAGARLVVLDFIFSGSPERWIDKLGLGQQEVARTFDQAFREQINSGQVQLSGFLVGQGERAEDFVLPSPDYLLALPNLDMVAHIGLANLESDADGIVRRFRVVTAGSDFARREGMPHFSFAGLAAARLLDRDLAGENFRFGDRDWASAAPVPTTFAGPPGTYKALSFDKLLQPGASELPEVKAMAGKVVVIGGGYAGDNDVHPTPYSSGLFGSHRMMPGPEVQANMVETLLRGRFLRDTPAAWRLALVLLSLGLFAAAAARLSPLRGLALALALALAAAAASYGAFLRDWMFPLAHLQIGLLVVLGSLTMMRFTREERERQRIGKMFGRYVSPQVVEALVASPELPELGGQTRVVTVLFLDIRGFTSISEKLSAREVVEMLNQLFERLCAVLLKEGATIDKFIGDCIMAEFGAPLEQPDHAARAVRAAVALQHEALAFRGWMVQRFADRHLPEFAIGVGIHSGEAVMGNIGSSARMEYTAIGDTVNLASRLEGKTKDTGTHILASAATVAMAGGVAPVGRRFELEVKGKAEPVEVYEILV